MSWKSLTRNHNVLLEELLTLIWPQPKYCSKTSKTIILDAVWVTLKHNWIVSPYLMVEFLLTSTEKFPSPSVKPTIHHGLMLDITEDLGDAVKSLVLEVTRKVSEGIPLIMVFPAGCFLLNSKIEIKGIIAKDKLVSSDN